MADHARLAPSSMKRIIACPGSVALGEGAQRYTSTSAEEGTAAHKLLEYAMLLDVEPHAWLGHVIERGPLRFEITEEMADAVAHARDWVTSYLERNPAAVVQLERRVYPGRCNTIQRDDCWGTLDISIRNLPQELVILDYKHGIRHYVEVENNEQLLTYAVGELWGDDPAAQYPWDMPVRLVIVQPRNHGSEGPVREFVSTVEDVFNFAKQIASAAVESDKPDAKLAVGEYCRFCPARPLCPEMAAHAQRLAQEEFSCETLRLLDPSSDRFGYLLTQVPAIKSWCDAVVEQAQRHMESGGRVPGHKLVRGKRSRDWYDQATARARLLAQGLDEDAVAPRYTVSPAEAEKLLKGRFKKAERKAALDAVAPLIKTSAGRLVVAPESDPRPAASRADDEFVDESTGDLLS